MFFQYFRGFIPAMILMILLAPLAFSAAKTPTPPAPETNKESLNKRQVQDLYFSGEFDPLIALLENMRRERNLRDRQDSVFIFKYLGVVYGADTTTRRKAESFLYAMLRLDPGQNLNDMEVGDNVESLFHQVKLRFDQSTKDSLLAREQARPARPQAPSPTHNSSEPGTTMNGSNSKNKTWIWVAGGAAAAAVATGAVLMLQTPDPETKTITTVVR